MACKHIYIGSHDGVTCALCGKHWSHDQYVAMINGDVSAPAEVSPEKPKNKGGRPPKAK